MVTFSGGIALKVEVAWIRLDNVVRKQMTLCMDVALDVQGELGTGSNCSLDVGGYSLNSRSSPR